VVFPSPQRLGPPAQSQPVRVPDATFRDLGFFVQDEWELGARVRVVGGLRLDSYRVASEATPGYDIQAVIAGARPPIDPATLPDPNGDSVERVALTGDVGLVFKATPKLSLVAHYGRSYRHPNLEELFFAGPATIGSIAPNVRVEPETGDNVDVGVKYRSARFAGSLSYFNNRYSGFISTEITALTPGSSVSQAINFADVRIQGAEADFEAPFRAGPAIVTLFGGGAYNHGEVLSGQNPLTGTSVAGTPQDNITPLKLAGGVRLSDRKGRLWLEYSLRHQADVERVAVTLRESPFLIYQDLAGLEGFTVQRLGAGWEWSQGGYNAGLTLNVSNLANRFYREQFQFAPARGRSLTVGLRLRRS
jgi:outer membrane receptor protein involved in Fe transport